MDKAEWFAACIHVEVGRLLDMDSMEQDDKAPGTFKEQKKAQREHRTEKVDNSRKDECIRLKGTCTGLKWLIIRIARRWMNLTCGRIDDCPRSRISCPKCAGYFMSKVFRNQCRGLPEDRSKKKEWHIVK